MKKLILILNLLLLNGSLFAQIDSNLIANYKFNGNTNNEVLTAANAINHGANLTIDRFGKADSAYQFGLDSQQITAAIPYSNTAAFTLSVWIKLDEYPGSKPGNGFANIFTMNGLSFYIQKVNDHKMNITASTRTTVGAGSLLVYPTDTLDFPRNVWYHFVYNHQPNGDHYLYLNGVELTSGLSSPDLKTGALMSFGNFYNNPQTINQFYGSIDDIRLYNVQLDLNRVKEIYLAEKPNTLNSNLVAHFKFNGNTDNSIVGSANAVNLNATLSVDRSGNVNSAYSFAIGPQLITAAVPHQNTSEISFSTWFKLSNYPGSVSGNNFSNLFTMSGLSFYIQNATNTTMNITASTRATTGPGSLLVFNIDTADLKLNTWMHIVYTAIPNGTHAIYLNGIKVTDGPNSSDLKSGTSMGFGNYFAGGSDANQFLGSLDDIRIYNKALSSNLVTELFNFEEILLGVGNAKNVKRDLLFYPNPTENIVYIEGMKSDEHVNIFDINGKLVFSSNEPTINISQLNQGIYIAKVLSASNQYIYSNKIIKK